jgi:glucose/arabinose dehydrogenase
MAAEDPGWQPRRPRVDPLRAFEVPRGEPAACPQIPPGNPFVFEPGALPEIWAFGFRNPWRFWIDAEARSVFIADAGNAQREEVSLASLDQPGANFGWPCFEGSLRFDTTGVCPNARPPILEYARSGSDCAVIGGLVVRDPRLSALATRYLYGDHCSGVLTVVTVENGRATATDNLGLVVPELTSFGLDGNGRVYAMSLRGDVFRLDPR